jgi:hypothetical protein
MSMAIAASRPLGSSTLHLPQEFASQPSLTPLAESAPIVRTSPQLSTYSTQYARGADSGRGHASWSQANLESSPSSALRLGDQIAPILGIEPRREAHRVDEIAEHHDDRTTFRVPACAKGHWSRGPVGFGWRSAFLRRGTRLYLGEACIAFRGRLRSSSGVTS